MAEEQVPERLLGAVRQLQADYVKHTQATETLAEEFRRRKSETRWFALGVVVFVTVVVCALMVMRHYDRAEESRRRTEVASQILTQRENLIAGCERGNDQRQLLAQVIVTSFEEGPPITLPPGYEALQSVLDQSADRAAAKRDRLLSLPGVQIINCQAAYPLTAR